MDILGTGDTQKLAWDLMELIEKALEKKDLALLKERYTIAQRAGFEIRHPHTNMNA